MQDFNRFVDGVSDDNQSFHPVGLLCTSGMTKDKLLPDEKNQEKQASNIAVTEHREREDGRQNEKKWPNPPHHSSLLVGFYLEDDGRQKRVSILDAFTTCNVHHATRVS